MTPAQVLAWAQVVNVLVSAGLATIGQIRQWFGAAQIMTNDQLNAILDEVLTDALKREAQAKAAAGG